MPSSVGLSEKAIQAQIQAATLAAIRNTYVVTALVLMLAGWSSNGLRDTLLPPVDSYALLHNCSYVAMGE